MNLLSRIKIPSFGQRQFSSIGLDIGVSFIKMLELEKKGSERTLKRFAAFELTPGGSLGEAIENFSRSQGFTGRQVNISLSGQSLVMRYISWPKMTLNELKSGMQFEAKGHIPFPLDEMVMDCAIVKEDMENNKMLVALAAVKKIAVQERLDMLQKAGLTSKIIDIDCFSLANAFIHTSYARDAAATPQAIALLNIGAHCTNMVIIQEGILRFSRDISFGGSQATLSSLCSEVTSSIDYYENQNGRPIEKIYLSGGAAGSTDISGFLNHQLGIAIADLDVFSGINFGEGVDKEGFKKQENSFVVALGLALR